MAVKEADIEEVYEKIREREDEKENQTLPRVPKDLKGIWVLALGVTAIAMLSKYISYKIGLIAIAFILIALKVLYGEDLGKKEYNEQQLVTALYKKLKYKQLYPLGDYYQIEPHLKIEIVPTGRRVLINGIPQERIFGVALFNPMTTGTEKWKYRVNIFTTDITGQKQINTWAELDMQDLKIMQSENMRDEIRYHKAMGTKPKSI